MRPKKITLTLLTPDADGIAQSQTPASGGVQSLTLNGAHTSGGAFSAATAHQISFTFAADESGRTFTITGTDQDGNTQTSTVSGTTPSTVEDTKYWKTISSITVDNNTAGAITVGTVDEAISQTVPLGNRNKPDVGLAIELTGTINATVQHALEEVMRTTHDQVSWYNHATLASITANTASNYASPVTATRLVVNSYTAGATISLLIVPGMSC